MKRKEWCGALLRPIPLVLGVVVITGCRTGTGKDAKPLGTELTASQLARTVRALDSIETVLKKGPGGAARADSAAAYASSVSAQLRLRPVTEPLTLPDSQSARNNSSFTDAQSASSNATITGMSPSAPMRTSPVQMVSAPIGIAPVPVVVPAQFLAPLWTLAPLAGATSATQVTVSGTAPTPEPPPPPPPPPTVVPEPGTLGLLASGLLLLAPLAIVRSRRSRRVDPLGISGAD